MPWMPNCLALGSQLPGQFQPLPGCQRHKSKSLRFNAALHVMVVAWMACLQPLLVRDIITALPLLVRDIIPALLLGK
jgi:hypothetical protein